MINIHTRARHHMKAMVRLHWLAPIIEKAKTRDIENVQRKATKKLQTCERLRYTERLRFAMSRLQETQRRHDRGIYIKDDTWGIWWRIRSSSCQETTTYKEEGGGILRCCTRRGSTRRLGCIYCHERTPAPSLPVPPLHRFTQTHTPHTHTHPNQFTKAHLLVVAEPSSLSYH